jgi:hypothetical protein
MAILRAAGPILTVFSRRCSVPSNQEVRQRDETLARQLVYNDDVLQTVWVKPQETKVLRGRWSGSVMRIRVAVYQGSILLAVWDAVVQNSVYDGE